jgi:hypothetical protein
MRITRNLFSTLKGIGALCLATGLLLSVPACTDNPVPYVAPVVHATGVTLNKATLGVVIGTPQTLTATVTPANATNTAVTWSSANTSIATVANGVVTPVAAGGPINITATTVDGSYTASCAVTVTASSVAVTSVSLSAATKTLSVVGSADTFKLTPTILPANATNTNVSWSSGTPTVASVDSNGNVTALLEGQSIITVTCADTTNGTKTATCTVTVAPGPYLYGFTNSGQVYTFDLGNQTWSANPTNTATVPTGVTLSFVVSADGNTLYGFAATSGVAQGTIYQMVGPTTGTWALASSLTNAAPGSPTAAVTFDGTQFETFTNTGKPSLPALPLSALAGGAWGTSTTLTGGKATGLIAAYYDGTNWWGFGSTGSVWEDVSAGGVAGLSWTAASTGSTGGTLVSVVSDGTTFYGITSTGLIYTLPVATAEAAGTTPWTNPYAATCGGALVAVVYN